MDEVELRLLRMLEGLIIGEGGGDSTADPVLVAVADLEDSGLGKLVEWTGARHKKVVGLRMAAVMRGAWPAEEPEKSILIFVWRGWKSKKVFFVVGLLA